MSINVTLEKYPLASLINDTVSIIRLRIMEKPIRFFTNVDSTIPNSLIGDQVQLRQILISLLLIAVEHTDKGQISLTVTQEKREGNRVWLKIVAADTGHGIKPENQGLAATKKICLDMGGDITVDSGRGKGNSFTVTIPHEVASEEPFAAVIEPQGKKVLVYERRTVYANSVSWSLKNMNVPHVMVTSQKAFEEALFREEWYFVFSGYDLHEKIRPLMERPAAGFANGKKPDLALMIEWGIEPHIPNVHLVSLPVQSLSIANVLNSRTDGEAYFESSEEDGAVLFSIPSARLLVVDDASINLMLVEGLLEPYKATVDTCLSGVQAIELVQKNNYDIIFMDHMMPELDGIDTTAAIRALAGEYFKTVPIIALTANAVSGVREMFIEKGFSDFLSKPIDCAKMDEILKRWIKEEKIESITDKKKLLILVDDDPVNLRAGKTILSEKYFVATAPSAEKLFILLKNNTPDLILLDIDMPGTNGYETIKKLKSNPETKDIPVIFLEEKGQTIRADTEASSDATGVSSDATGASGHVSKPFDAENLFACIRRHIS
jgi:CheY-like chemotaxis protein